ncbi:MAG: STAS domain-containing protein [Patescibacteria group bacterium]|jgi:anti-sigma B factor antagonist
MQQTPGPQFLVVSRGLGGWTVVSVEGEIDIYTVPELCDCLDRVLNEGCYNIVIDLSRVSFMDASGISAISRYYKKASQNNGEVKLVGVSSRVKRILGLAKRLSVIRLYRTLEEAIEPQ